MSQGSTDLLPAADVTTDLDPLESHPRFLSITAPSVYSSTTRLTAPAAAPIGERLSATTPFGGAVGDGRTGPIAVRHRLASGQSETAASVDWMGGEKTRAMSQPERGSRGRAGVSAVDQSGLPFHHRLGTMQRRWSP
ncbi:hypothetical protein chiPu_0014925 [Chiloscyllium punctatum]|uniref:Uncharacterized protein n=1 Tax=Chiloscyllium punctatum TaxID=137246 RepID=A0A401T1C4_CHIPU|nr:hypothetical protein [Chiloscyllium punctatum]